MGNVVAFCYRDMSQPVKLSDVLVLDARIAGQAMERSIASQVEFWARLGRAIEPLLRGVDAIALSRKAQPISEAIASVNTLAGREQLTAYLNAQPFPHYEPDANEPGVLIRTEADGTRTLGRFVNRKFQPRKKQARGAHRRVRRARTA